jgi:hypothetical protein
MAFIIKFETKLQLHNGCELSGRGSPLTYFPKNPHQ